MEIQGTIIAELPMVQGTKRDGGEWFKQEYILETQGQYPKKVCFSLWNEKIDQYNLHPGLQVKAHVEVESREYNGKWFTEVKAWKVEIQSRPESKDPQASAPSQARPQDPVPPLFQNNGEEDDLPF